MKNDVPQKRPELSFVIPCYNEEENVAQICQAVTVEAERYVKSHEIVLIDNGSTDATRTIIRDLCEQDDRIKAIFNTRNFGQIRSPTHAIFQTSGDLVIGLCADFQDPPEMIGEFLRARKEGALIVLAQRKEEKTSWMLRIVRNSCYKLLERYADYPAIPNVTGFGLYDRKVIDTLAKWDDPEPFFRGMLVETGFRLQILPFQRPQRFAGKTKNNFSSLLDFALSSLASSSKNMLRLPLFWSLFIALISMVFVAAALISFALNGPVMPFVLLSVQFGIFATLLGFIGLIGIQIRAISERTRNTPLVVEEERLNFVDHDLTSD